MPVNPLLERTCALLPGGGCSYSCRGCCGWGDTKAAGWRAALNFKIMTKTKLKSGQKQTMASRCLQCFADNVPPDITVHFRTLAELQKMSDADLGDKLYGLADAATRKVWVRKPTTPNLLVIAIHELAHLVLLHSLRGHIRKPGAPFRARSSQVGFSPHARCWD